MYTLINPPQSSDILGCWRQHLGDFSEVVGYSSLGLLFLRNRQSFYMVLHPLRVGLNAKKYGPFPSLADFEASVLQDPAFMQEHLRPNDLKFLEKQVGKLDDYQVYFPVPYPFMGGSGTLDTYDKGNIWVFADIVGQSQGLGSLRNKE